MDLQGFGARLKRCIKEGGFGYTETERNVGIRWCTLQRLLHGDKMPSVEILGRLCEYLHVSADFLLDIKI